MRKSSNFIWRVAGFTSCFGPFDASSAFFCWIVRSFLGEEASKIEVVYNGCKTWRRGLLEVPQEGASSSAGAPMPDFLQSQGSEIPFLGFKDRRNVPYCLE